MDGISACLNSMLSPRFSSSADCGDTCEGTADYRWGGYPADFGREMMIVADWPTPPGQWRMAAP